MPELLNQSSSNIQIEKEFQSVSTQKTEEQGRKQKLIIHSSNVTRSTNHR